MRTLKLFIVLLVCTNAYAEGGDSLNKVTETVPGLSIINLKQVLIDEGVQHADIVLRQAITETGWFKCVNCSLSRNNIFGFYYKKKYLQFDNWIDCVKYYKRWQDRHYKGGDYYAFLKKVGFATNPRYVQDLKSLKL
ncbi:MAG: glucosaminidase domain-containing protein [Flavobacteriales bacterium]|nr:glucosaminidase domain-containing protein [Flavobacteriales bacterium]